MDKYSKFILTVIALGVVALNIKSWGLAPALVEASASAKASVESTVVEAKNYLGDLLKSDAQSSAGST